MMLRLVAVDEGLIKSAAQYAALRSEPQSEGLLKPRLSCREVHQDRVLPAFHPSRRPAPLKVRLPADGRSIVRWPELTIHVLLILAIGGETAVCPGVFVRRDSGHPKPGTNRASNQVT
jgi:hypothetical protein